jgi:hypothetical protein
MMGIENRESEIGNRGNSRDSSHDRFEKRAPLTPTLSRRERGQPLFSIPVSRFPFPGLRQ